MRREIDGLADPLLMLLSFPLAPQVYGLDPNYVDPVVITQKVIQGVYSGVTTSELDELAAQTGAFPLPLPPDTRPCLCLP
jgi:hypothetical protein